MGLKRFVSAKEATASELSGLLWLPTHWEMFGNRTYSVAADETKSNQARLEYYDEDWKRVKHLENRRESYWVASPSDNEFGFCFVLNTGTASRYHASTWTGVAPAFCVK